MRFAQSDDIFELDFRQQGDSPGTVSAAHYTIGASRATHGEWYNRQLCLGCPYQPFFPG